MKVYNETKLYEIFDYDLKKGYLKEDKIVLKHHEAIPERVVKSVGQLIAEYKAQGKEVITSSNGDKFYVVKEIYSNKNGKTVEEIKPIVELAKPEYDDTEDIQVYIPYTETELNKREIAELKRNLSNTDYKAIKYAEGLITEEEYAPIKAQRQEWRNRINYLELLM